ncbi:MAG TPA: hypothetical protein VFY67_04380 [Pyrinomonadaceae bacterium]|nr:hypothetical protein [Pyrinomonadaceae bacterium]
MKPSLQIVARDEPESLPILASEADVREVIRFLRHHSEGVTPMQAMDGLRKRIFDARKVSAYEFWKIVLRNGDRLKLSPLGWELAKCLTPEAEIYRTVLRNTTAYHGGLKWIQEQDLELVTHVDIGEFWREHHSYALQSESQEQLEAHAASFFHVCHAAEVGTLTVGRKGQPTRLNIYPRELESYLNGHGGRVQSAGSPPPPTFTSMLVAGSTNPGLFRVFVSHDQTPALMNQITNVLELADLQCETLDRSRNTIDKTLVALRRCEAGVIVITEERIDDLLLMQIGAALIHFERRLLFLVSRRCDQSHVYPDKRSKSSPRHLERALSDV